MRTVALVLIYTVIIILVTPFVLVCMAIGLREPLVALGRWAMALSRVVLGIRIEIEGREHIPRGQPVVFMANHLSFLDGPMLFLILPQPVRVILKKSIFRIPVVGFGMRFVGFVPVDRKGKEGGKKSILKAARMMTQRGYSFFIFPEGTRSRDGRLQAFRRGGFFLAMGNSRMLFLSGVASAIVLISAIWIGVSLGRLESIAWALVFAFHINFVHAYLLLHLRVFRVSPARFFGTMVGPACLVAALALASHVIRVPS